MPMRRSANVRVRLPSTKRVDVSVLTVRPAALKVRAGVVGGSDSTRPSSWPSPAPLRTSLSTEADAPATVTTTSMVWDAWTVSIVTVAFAPPPVSCSWTVPGGTFINANRPAASTVELMFVPTTVTVTPVIAGPAVAAVSALVAPCTLPVIIAAEPLLPAVDGEVGDALLPPHPTVSSAAATMSPSIRRISPPVAHAEQYQCLDEFRRCKSSRAWTLRNEEGRVRYRARRHAMTTPWPKLHARPPAPRERYRRWRG